MSMQQRRGWMLGDGVGWHSGGGAAGGEAGGRGFGEGGEGEFVERWRQISAEEREALVDMAVSLARKNSFHSIFLISLRLFISFSFGTRGGIFCAPNPKKLRP